MRFFGWALIQHEPRPYRKGGMGQRQTHSEEKTMWRHRRIPGGDQSDTDQKLEEAEKGPPLYVPEGAEPVTPELGLPDPEL